MGDTCGCVLSICFCLWVYCFGLSIVGVSSSRCVFSRLLLYYLVCGVLVEWCVPKTRFILGLMVNEFLMMDLVMIGCVALC